MNSIAKVVLLSAVVALPSQAFAGKIVYVDSYHQGYAWSDDILAGIKEKLEGTGTKLVVEYMDTKRHGEVEFKEQAAKKALDLIKAEKPDVVIACDDNAVKYLVVPYLKGTNTPVVFCGVNWNAKPYGFPASNVTGMVEVSAAGELISLMRQFAKGDRIALVAADTESEVSQYENMSRAFPDIKFGKPAYVKTLDAFKKAFVAANESADMVLFMNAAGINDWDEAAAADFVQKNTKVVTGAFDGWMGKYVVFAYGKVGQEQGRWSAQTAVEIMGGKSPASIPLVTNKEGNIVVNAKLANSAKIEVPVTILQTATAIIE